MRRRKPPQGPLPPTAGGPVTMMKVAEIEPLPLDRISALPDELLGEIIFLLPVKDGARTQVLASRWRPLWRSVPLNLDSCDLIADMPSDSSSLVSRVLSAHPGPGHSFCVRSQCSPLTVDAWLRSAALNNLEELDIGGSPNFIHLPASIFRFSATLRVANIRDCRLPDAAAAQGLCIPHLKQLGLNRVQVSERSLHALIAGCPALEFLMVLDSYGFSCIRINSPSLTGLCLCERKPYYDGEILIENVPCLERFIHLSTLWGRDVSVYSMTPKGETLDFLPHWEDFATKLVSGSRVIPGLPMDNLTMAVHTVKSLSFNIYDPSLDKVVHLMRLFPCLEKLHLKSKVSESKNSWRRKHRNFIRCHDIHLKTLVLEPFLDTVSHVNFVTFFVLNARALELMKFQIEAKLYNQEFLAEQHRKLQLENKASKGARFHFTTASCQHAVWKTKHARDFNFNDPFVCGC